MNTAISLDGAQAILTYPFKDPRWKMKILIGALIGFAGRFIPIVPSILLLGYSATIMRGIIVDNAGASLPEWEDWGTFFSRGLRIFGVMVIFLLPIIVLFVGAYFLMMIPFITAVTTADQYGRSMSSELTGFQILGSFGGLGMFLLGLLLSLPISIFLPPAIAHSVAKDSFAAAFHFREQWKILRANFGGFFTSIILLMGLYYLLIFAMQMMYFTVILCCLLPIVISLVTLYMSLVSAAAVAEAYRRGVEKSTPAPESEADSLLSSD
jgi:hypothetical protein